jgi:nitroreductase
MTKISSKALDQLFREGRTLRAWCPEPVPEALLKELYELARLGPTSANTPPARFVFITSAEAKARLCPRSILAMRRRREQRL